MESQQRTGHPESEDGNQMTNQTQSLDQKGASPILRVEAQIQEGEKFPELQDHSSVFMKNKIVLFGGRNQSVNELKIYDLGKRTWSSKRLRGKYNEIPYTRYLHTANAVGDFIFVIGGQVKYVDTDPNVYRINFTTQQCQIIGNITDAVSDHTADFYEKSICIFGGKSSKTYQSTSLFQKFNLQTNVCEVIKPTGYQPEGRLGHKSVIVSDNLYVFGGWSRDKSLMQDLFSIDLSSHVSTKIDQHGLIPSPRRYFSFFARKNQLYLFGGASKVGVYQDFYGFNVKSQTWYLQQTKNQKCLLKRFANSVAVKEDLDTLKVYMVGGKESFSDFQKNINVITISIERIYWVLHYLESTGIHNLPGYSLVQEIIQMLE